MSNDEYDVFYNDIENIIDSTMTKSLSKPHILRFFQLIDKILYQQTNDLIKHYNNNHPKLNRSKTIDNQSAINIIIPYQNNQHKPLYFPSQYFYPNQVYPSNNQPPTIPMQAQPSNYLSSYQFQQLPYSIPTPQAHNLPKKKNKSSKSDKKPHKSKKEKKDHKHKKGKNDKKKVTDDSKSIDCSNGIFQYLFTKHGGNPVNKGLIQITGNSLAGGYERCLPKIIDNSWRDNFWCSSGYGDRYVEIVFNKMLVKIKKYRLRVGFPSGNDYFASWTLSAVTEEGKNVVLAKVVDSSEIKVNAHEATFSTQEELYVKSVKLTMNGEGRMDTAMRLRNIELYGFIKDL